MWKIVKEFGFDDLTFNNDECNGNIKRKGNEKEECKSSMKRKCNEEEENVFKKRIKINNNKECNDLMSIGMYPLCINNNEECNDIMPIGTYPLCIYRYLYPINTEIMNDNITCDNTHNVNLIRLTVINLLDTIQSLYSYCTPTVQQIESIAPVDIRMVSNTHLLRNLAIKRHLVNIIHDTKSQDAQSIRLINGWSIDIYINMWRQCLKMKPSCKILSYLGLKYVKIYHQKHPNEELTFFPYENDNRNEKIYPVYEQIMKRNKSSMYNMPTIPCDGSCRSAINVSSLLNTLFEDYPTCHLKTYEKLLEYKIGKDGDIICSNFRCSDAMTAALYKLNNCSRISIDLQLYGIYAQKYTENTEMEQMMFNMERLLYGKKGRKINH